MMLSRNGRVKNSFPIAVLGIVFTTSNGLAQEDYAIGQMAAGVIAYEESSDQCYYDDPVGLAIDKIDSLLKSTRGDEWEEAKTRAQGSGEMAANMAKVAGSSPCVAYGLLVGDGLARGLTITGFNPSLMKEIDRLSANAGGRALDESAIVPKPENSYYTCSATVVRPICISGYPATLNDCKDEDIVYPIGSRVELQDTYVINGIRMLAFYKGMDASMDHYQVDKGCNFAKLRCQLMDSEKNAGESCN